MANLKVNTVSGIGTEGTVFDGGLKFRSLNYMTLPKGDTAQRGRGRALIMGGIYPESTRMETYSLISSSNGVEFGTLSAGNNAAWGGALASSTRGVIAGGNSQINNISYVEIPTLGDSIDFGNLSVGRRHAVGVSNNIRGMWGGGETAGGTTQTDTIDFVTIASTGDAQDFGNLTDSRRGCAGGASPTRGLFASGDSPGAVNIIDYVTIASTGDATDFGDLFQAVYSIRGCSASHIRGNWNGGYSTAYINVIQSITFSTTGNSVDWGDMANAKGGYNGTTSDSHGGLSE